MRVHCARVGFIGTNENRAEAKPSVGSHNEKTMIDADESHPRGNVNDARINRYAKVDLTGITVHKAITDADFDIVARLRKQGFSRVADKTDIAWVDSLDHSPGVFSLIAYNNINEPLATMRVQDGRISELELSRFVPLNSILNPDQKPLIQGARLSVIKMAQASDAMIALFKAVWLWCLNEEIRNIVIATPPWAKPIYEFLSFDDLGPRGHFSHEFLTDTPHSSMIIPVKRPITVWPDISHPLFQNFCCTDHPSLVFV